MTDSRSSSGSNTLREVIAGIVDPDAKFQDIEGVTWSRFEIQRRELAYQKANSILGILPVVRTPALPSGEVEQDELAYACFKNLEWRGVSKDRDDFVRAKWKELPDETTTGPCNIDCNCDHNFHGKNHYRELAAALASSPTPQIAGDVREALIDAERFLANFVCDPQNCDFPAPTDILAKIRSALSPQAQASETKSAPVFLPSHTSDERLPSSDAADAGAGTASPPFSRWADTIEAASLTISPKGSKELDALAAEVRAGGVAQAAPEPEAYRETVRRVAAVREKRMAKMREALERIRNFPHDKTACEQAMSQIAGEALAIPSTHLSPGEG